MIIKQGQVRSDSSNGQPVDTTPIHEFGFRPGSVASVVITSWYFEFKFGDHPVKKIGMLLRSADHQAWYVGVPVQPDGSVAATYLTYAGSENQDNPFTAVINYA